MKVYLQKANDKLETAEFLNIQKNQKFYGSIIHDFYYSMFSKICFLLLKTNMKEYDFKINAFKFALKFKRDEDHIGGYHVWFAYTSGFHFSEYCYENSTLFDHEKYFNLLEKLRNLREKSDYDNNAVTKNMLQQSVESYYHLSELLQIIED